MNEQSRDVRAIRLPQSGRAATDSGVVPWLVFDEEGKAVQPVRRFLIDFIARDNRTGSVRSHAYDLLRWWRWLRVIDVGWNRPGDGRSQLVDLGMPVFTGPPATPTPPGESPHAPDAPDLVRLPAPPHGPGRQADPASR